MKKMCFRFIALLAALVFCASCSGKAASTPAPASSGDAAPAQNAPAQEAPPAAPAAATKLVMAFPTWTGAPPDTATVQKAMSDYLKEKLGVEIELQISDAGSFSQNMTLALSSGEQIDIMSTLMAGYGNLVSQGYLLDLEEDGLFGSYGQGVIEAMGDPGFVDACRVNGILYGLPNNRDLAQGRGCVSIGTEYLDAIGYKAPDNAPEIIPITQAEVEELWAKLHEAFPDKETYRPVAGSIQQYTDIDFLGGSAFGVLLDYGKELKVVNLFESAPYREYCDMIYGYNQKGYISPDAATDTTDVLSLTAAGVLVGYTTGGKPGSKQQESNGAARDMTILQTKGDLVASTSVAGMPWAIPITTIDKVAAMKTLNEFYVDPELANMLAYGIKDVHYRVLDSGLADYPEGKDATSNGFGTLPWLVMNQFNCYVWNGADPDLWNNMRKFNQEANKSKASGFAFDTAPVATELTAVQNVYTEYQASVEYGFVDPAIGIPEMNKKMMDAGLQKIIDEKQRQLDIWAAN
ncbi:MAG: ABC transporter substrate-binding protein [Clostridiales bacterium]|nr:ABC transporter substrate-binding protein [Clostridiales bacterium]